MKRTGRLAAAAALLTLGLALPIFGAGRLSQDRPFPGFPDSGKLRASLYAKALAAPRAEVLKAKPTVYENEYGRFRLSTETSADAFYLVLAAARGGDYPIWAQGSWVIKRDLEDGRFLQAKVFLRSDPGCFLRIFPSGGRSLMDVVLYGAVLNKDVILPASLDQVLTSPISAIVAWTEDLVDWDLWSPQAADYAALREFSAAIRSRIGALRYVDDGGLDAQGRPIFIATGKAQPRLPGLNCSGFAQWVVDGILGPQDIPWLDAESLKERHPELRKAAVDPAIDDRYEPFFGLDWTRNLGQARAWALGPGRRPSITENDVADYPFSLYSAAGDPRNGGPPYDSFPAYDVDSGYQMRGLKAILYLRAIRDPGAAYLASLSRVDGTGLRRHYHVSILLPWFDEEGNFRVDVFESAAETSLGAILTRAPRDRVHLVRLAPSPDFDPPQLP